MGYAQNVGKYYMTRLIGEGSFAKVKLAVNSETGERVAIKIIDKKMVRDSKLTLQIVREISAMKILHHPNVVRIYEVIASKTTIFIVMEYVPGGQLSDKVEYLKKLDEDETRKYFHQLIDAVDYCHSMGIYHRDLKPENLLLDGKGNLKVSDFGFSALQQPSGLLSTTCGSPSYVAPEVISRKCYEGAAADVWSCGVILFECLAGFLPFQDRSLPNLYRKICIAEYKFPAWFTSGQKRLIGKILNPDPLKRAMIAEILEDEWFGIGYRPSSRMQAEEEHVNLNDVNQELHKMAEIRAGKTESDSSNYINAFQLIAMSKDLDLSGLFEHEVNDKQKTKLGSAHSLMKTLEKIENAAKDESLSVKRMNNSKLSLHGVQNSTRSRSHLLLSAEIVELTPRHCMIEVSKSVGKLTTYEKKFIKFAQRGCNRARVVSGCQC